MTMNQSNTNPNARVAVEMDSLLQAGIRKHFEQGDIILGERSKTRSIPFVISGSVKVLRVDEDKELVLYHLQPGDNCIMSLMAGMFQDVNNVRMVADDACEISYVPIEAMQQAMRDNPDWLIYIFQIYHKRFIEILDVVDAIAFKRLDDRLFQYLEKKVAVTGSRSLILTHEQLAQELGSAREVISRLLKQMEAKNIVELGRNRITLM
jgi:CRP/FNR family transcriptional regulator